MPNWCTTDYVIEGPHEILEKIHEAILYPEVEEEASVEWEGNVLNTLGISWDRLDPNNEDKPYDYMRGFIGGITKFNRNTLKFYAEEAWGVTDFNLVLEKNFPDIKVYFNGEEPDMEVYLTNDKEDKYFPDRYFVDTCINEVYNSEYFKTKDKAYKWLSKISNNKVTNEEQVEAFNKDPLNEDDFIYVHEFAIVDNNKIRIKTEV